MYRIVITSRGHAALSTEERTLTHQTLATLIAYPVEAATPRALFELFCARLNARLDVPPSADVSRSLWQALAEDDLIVVRGSALTDAGLAFASQELLSGRRSRWWVHPDAASHSADQPSAPVLSPANVPLVPRCITDWFHDALVRLVHPLRDAVR